MTFDYAAANLKVKALIEKFGASASFVKDGAGGGGYDDFGNVIPAEPDTTYTGTVTPILQYKKDEIDGTTIKMGDGYVFFYPSGSLPPIDSKITINSTVWRLVDIMRLDSVGGVNVFFKCQLRR